MAGLRRNKDLVVIPTFCTYMKSERFAHTETSTATSLRSGVLRVVATLMPFIIIIIIIINPITARVVGAPQMILQPVQI